MDWQACRLCNDDDTPMNREELIDNFIEHVDRGFRETGTYDFYFVNMDDDGEDLTVCMTGNGPRSEKHAKEISLIPSAIDKIQTLTAEVERLAKKREEDLERITYLEGHEYTTRQRAEAAEKERDIERDLKMKAYFKIDEVEQALEKVREMFAASRLQVASLTD